MVYEAYLLVSRRFSQIIVKGKGQKVEGKRVRIVKLIFHSCRFSQIIAKGKGQKVKGKRVRIVKFIFSSCVSSRSQRDIRFFFLFPFNF